MSKVSQAFKYTINGKEYEIKFKKPTIGEQIKISTQASALKAGMPVDNLGEKLCIFASTMETVIVDKPKDLDFLNLDTDDWETVEKMFNDYDKFAFFRGKTPQADTKA